MGADSGIPVKVSYNGSVRKFVVPWEGTSWSEFERLMKTVHSINEPILATYLDQDREFIAFDTDSELAALLSAIPRDGRTALRVFVKTLSQLERSNAILPPPSSHSAPQKFPDDPHNTHSGGASDAYASKEFSDTSYRSQTTPIRSRLPSVDENWNIVMDSGNYHPGALRASAGSSGLVRSYAHDPARDSVQSQAPSMMSSYLSTDANPTHAGIADTMGALALDDQAAKRAVAAAVGEAGDAQGREKQAQMKALVDQLRESFAGHPEVLKQLDVVWSKVSAENSSANLEYAIGEINRVIQAFQSGATLPASSGSTAPRRVVRNAGFQPELPSAGKLDRAELDRKSITLHEMGFTDDDLNMALLIEFEGDIERCVEILSNGV